MKSDFCIVIVLLLTLTVAASATGDEIFETKIDLREAVGRIYLMDHKTRVGTPFVAGNTLNIFTPAHVALEDSLYYKPYGNEYWYGVILKYILNDYDLAIYRRKAGRQPVALKIGSFNKVHIGDTIHYMGWDSDTVLTYATGIVESKGQTRRGNESIDFIEFKGNCVPGYSGGPVLNSAKEAIAMIVQGYDLHSIKVNRSWRVIRAFSIDLLRVLEQNVLNSTVEDSVANSGDISLEQAEDLSD